MKLGESTIIDHAPEDREDPSQIAWTLPASDAAVAAIIATDPDDPDNGRSEWLWVRLANGDLILGVFPQGDAYLDWEQEHS